MKTLSISGVLLALSLSALPVAFASAATEPVQAQAYVYGMNLDVAKVISIDTPSAPDCEIVQSKMIYLDGAGAPHSITYQTQSELCAIGS